MSIKYSPIASNYFVISEMSSWQQQQIHSIRTTPHQLRYAVLLAVELSWSIVLSKCTVGLFGVLAVCCSWCFFFLLCCYYNW